MSLLTRVFCHFECDHLRSTGSSVKSLFWISVRLAHRSRGVVLGLAAVEDQGVGQEVEEGQEVERAAQEGENDFIFQRLLLANF